MAKPIHDGMRKAVKTVAHKARVGRSVYVMKPEYLAEIKRFRLMDDDFMSKCLENAPECIEFILQIILGKKDLKVVKSHQELRRREARHVQGNGRIGRASRTRNYAEDGEADAEERDACAERHREVFRSFACGG